jgi:transcriptional regulator with XRE-family HTH domain
MALRMTTPSELVAPFADTAITSFLKRRIYALKDVKTQREIAVQSGFESPNIISMFKHGHTKVPLDKVPALAKALDVNPGHLFRLALEQYWPGAEATIDEIFGRLATKNEEEILLKKWRAATNDADPASSPLIEDCVERFMAEVDMVLARGAEADPADELASAKARIIELEHDKRMLESNLRANCLAIAKDLERLAAEFHKRSRESTND